MVDLRRLEFMDCSGLRVLLGAQLRAGALRARFEVVCGPGQVARLLTLTGADQKLKIAASPETVMGPRREPTAWLLQAADGVTG